MIRNKPFIIALLSILASFVSSKTSSQSSEDLVGRWEGVHYYGDTTRLFDGTLVVRASTIDSMRMILTIEQLIEGKFKGQLHEHFYSDPDGTYFNAEVKGFIQNDTIHFSSFEIKKNRMPQGNRWCKPKATGLLVNNDTVFFLHMSFESTLTCTIGPAILERRITQSIATTPVLPEKEIVINKIESPPVIQQKQNESSIEEEFKKRNRSLVRTINVQSDTIKVNFVDNGTVDGDSISVFVNGKLAASHVRLSTAVFTLNVQFENGVDEIEVAMFAENLGAIPPNTALMQIIDGRKVHKAFLKGDTSSNAVIKLRKVK
jgi:hypothetical protein